MAPFKELFLTICSQKITARYVPKHLTQSQKAERVRICQENLLKFEQGVWRLCDVVTGDES